MKEKIHRLSPELYNGKIYVAEKILLQELEKYSCSSLIYLFMNNHIHMIIKGESESSKILDFMKSFKQKSGYLFSKHYPEIKWQKDFLILLFLQ